jgi:protease-4
MKTGEIEAIAQGRVWSGSDGKRIGLVDVLGGLETAIEIAKDRAGLARREVTIVEYPKPGLFDFSSFMPRLFGVELAQPDPLIEHLKFRLKNNGVPMPMLPLEDMDWTRMY